MKRKWIALLMAAVMAMSFTGCGTGTQEGKGGENAASSAEPASPGEGEAEVSNGESSEEITLRVSWWGSQSRHDLTQQALELYMKDNPNVKVEAEFTDWSGYWDKLATQAAGGELPDVIQMDYSYLSQYASSKQLADLNGYLESGVIERSDISDSIIES